MALPVLGLAFTSMYKKIVGVHYCTVATIFLISWINFYFIVKKPDILQACKLLLTCRCFSDNISSERRSMFVNSKRLENPHWTSSNFFSSEFFVRDKPQGGSTELECKECNNSQTINMVAIPFEDEKCYDIVGERKDREKFVISDEFRES